MKIHQLAENCFPGDAISQHALEVQSLLLEMGHKSVIFCQNSSAEYSNRTSPVRALFSALHPDDILIHHHSSGCESVCQAYLRARCRKGLWYHNITPPFFFQPYSKPHFESCRRGYDYLKLFRPMTEFTFADSTFNATELKRFGYNTPFVLPILLPAAESAQPDAELVKYLRCSNTVNFLFVGRIAPNKRHEDVIRTFAWYNQYINRNSMLHLVGSYDQMEYYYHLLCDVAEDCGVAGLVAFTGKVSASALSAYYACADLFLCLSDHEGFCIPLLEAMRAHVPVLAKSSGAVPETMGDAGILLHRLDVPLIAETAEYLRTTQTFRETVLARQDRHVESFSYSVTAEKIRQTLRRIIGS